MAISSLDKVYLIMSSWDSIIAVLRLACPKLGIYGEDRGGDLPKMLELLRDEALIARVAQAVAVADSNYEIATREATQKIAAARIEHSKEIDEIVKSIRGV